MIKNENRVHPKTKPRQILLWASLWLFLGLVIDTLAGIKSTDYLDNDIRRSMWQLAHMHGMLLPMFVVLTQVFIGIATRPLQNLMLAGMVLMPVGFFLGGLWPTETDPFVGIFLVPIGGLCFFIGFVMNARREGKTDLDVG